MIPLYTIVKKNRVEQVELKDFDNLLVCPISIIVESDVVPQNLFVRIEKLVDFSEWVFIKYDGGFWWSYDKYATDIWLRELKLSTDHYIVLSKLKTEGHKCWIIKFRTKDQMLLVKTVLGI